MEDHAVVGQVMRLSTIPDRARRVDMRYLPLSGKLSPNLRRVAFSGRLSGRGVLAVHLGWAISSRYGSCC